MRRTVAFLMAATLVMSLVLPAAVLAAPPANDDPTAPTVIGGLPFTAAFDLAEATDDTAYPPCEAFVHQQIWYSYSPGGDEVVRVSTGGLADVEISVWRVGADVTDLTRVSCGSFGGSADAQLMAGQDYLISLGVNGFGTEIAGAISVDVVLPPANDDFANAEVISATPFAGTIPDGRLVAATLEPGEPTPSCGAGDFTRSVWYVYTAPVDLTAVPRIEGGHLAVYSGTALDSLTLLACLEWGETSIALSAGESIYLQAQPWSGNPVLLDVRIAPTNDDFADARAIDAVPFSTTYDGSGVTVESGEPQPCGWQDGTAWFAYTPSESGTYIASVSSWWPAVVTVYTGASLDSLSEVACGGSWQPLGFAATAGTTYYIQVTGRGDWIQFDLALAPPPNVDFSYWPWDPSTFDAVQFSPGVWDPASMAVDSWAWDFGDGTTSTDVSPVHRFAANGDYPVTLHVTMVDGRVGERSYVVQVRTRDLAITKFTVPKAARAGQTRSIVVGIVNRIEPEVVRVSLYRSTPAGEMFVASTDVTVPVRPANRTTDVSFTYAFTSDDAAVGKVTFRAVVEPLAGRDAFPADNQAIKTTTVTQ